MPALWDCCSFVCCFMLFIVFLNCNISFGNEIRTRRSGFYEALKPWENHRGRRRRASHVICRNRALNAKQQTMCLKFPQQVEAVFRAYREAVNECQYQFRNERWNCSSLVSMDDGIIPPFSTKLMTKGFKEAAFVHALVAASVAKAISLDCARGVITSCDKMGSKRRRSKKEYVGYDQAITHGLYFSEKFLNSGKSSDDIQGVVDRHNLRAGRLAFKKALKTICKCHGVSGSCTKTTCIETATNLRPVGSAIKTLFDNAQKVEPMNQQRKGVKLLLDQTRKTSKTARNTPTKTELLYTENSPTFCERDDTLGTPGVSGRICSKDPSDANSCRTMCCGTGYMEFWTKEENYCECKRTGCCSVQCKKCTKQKLIAKCR